MANGTPAAGPLAPISSGRFCTPIRLEVRDVAR